MLRPFGVFVGLESRPIASPAPPKGILEQSSLESLPRVYLEIDQAPTAGSAD
ncbi:MAG: hypothetical protein ACUVS7_04365 [Bryobacteraceae bacterium]